VPAHGRHEPKELNTMSQRVWHDEDGLVYYELRCDSCRTRFACYDDTCYDWRLLRDAARWTGWDTRTSDPAGPHHCPTCHRHARQAAVRPASATRVVPVM
jgi:hypothetical protein